MTAFDDQLAIDGELTYMQEFSEPAVYLPKKGESVDIQAVIDRNSLQPRRDINGDRLQYEIEVEFAVSAVAAVNKGGDRIRFAKVRGGTDMDERALTHELPTQHPGLHRWGLA